jgi:hypothetical protein
MSESLPTSGLAWLRRRPDRGDVVPVDVHDEPVEALELDGIRVIAPDCPHDMLLGLGDRGLVTAEEDVRVAMFTGPFELRIASSTTEPPAGLPSRWDEDVLGRRRLSARQPTPQQRALVFWMARPIEA